MAQAPQEKVFDGPGAKASAFQELIADLVIRRVLIASSGKLPSATHCAKSRAYSALRKGGGERELLLRYGDEAHFVRLRGLRHRALPQ